MHINLSKERENQIQEIEEEILTTFNQKITKTLIIFFDCDLYQKAFS